MSIRQEKDLIGERFGRLTVISQEPKRHTNKGFRYYWKCQCECGKIVIVREDLLLSHNRPTQSCGCLKADVVKLYYAENPKPNKHGHSREPLFNIWYLMKQRCENANNKSFHNYGGRGIKVCSEWDDDIPGYEAFRDWSLANGYRAGLTIDRIDNDKDYSPDNCRWVDKTIQARNTRRNIWIEYNGVKKLACEWAYELNIPYKTFMSRIYRGWDIEKIIKQPLRKSSK